MINKGIVLVGARGSGKTTVGRILAEELDVPFVDSDQEVARRSGRSIKRLFEEAGEQAFRDWEERVIADLAMRNQSLVLATGGGVVLRHSNRRQLRRLGRVVWLTAHPQILARRLASDPDGLDSRPALTSAGVLDELEAILAERSPLYQSVADLTVDSTHLTPQQAARAIIEHWPTGS